MALRGTLKDFGIADIFQLIGHQGKSGVLTVTEKRREVRVHFRDGNVVRATTSTRREKHLLGRMLVRAEVLDEAQLDHALEIHRSSGRRIGDVLVDSAVIDRETLSSFYRLQTHETIYQLFLWTSGNYEFNAEDVLIFDDEEPLRSETVLMEGFRQVDEWPSIRKNITSYGLKFDVLVDLDTLGGASPSEVSLTDEDDEDFDLDAAFSALNTDSGVDDPRLKNVGAHERKVYQLITPERDVQKVIDLSRLGEFETCKALSVLMDSQIIRPSASEKTATRGHAAIGGGITAGRAVGLGSAALRLLAVAGAVVLFFMAADKLGYETRLFARGPTRGFQSQALQQELTRARLAVIKRGLEAYHARFGRYPESLQTLARTGWVSERDLSFPWAEAYYYEGEAGSYRLLRPLE